jgi:predicted HTH domain antitoxin
MRHMQIDIPDSAFAALRQEPSAFLRELRLAAAIKWYEMGRLSQERAAELAAMSRREFLDALARWRVAAVQVTAQELQDEVNLA